MLPVGVQVAGVWGQMMYSQAYSSRPAEPSSFKGFNLVSFVCLILNATHIYLTNTVFSVVAF